MSADGRWWLCNPTLLQKMRKNEAPGEYDQCLLRMYNLRLPRRKFSDKEARSVNRVTWIHLSDLHMETEDRFYRNVVHACLWKDIAQLRAQGVKPDFIAFTGDVAY